MEVGPQNALPSVSGQHSPTKWKPVGRLRMHIETTCA
jgi:hypothetical protein